MCRTKSEELQQAEEAKKVADEIETFSTLAGESNAEQLRGFMTSAINYEQHQQQR